MRGREEFGETKFMNCGEFQKVLPYIIETGGNAEEEAHLRSCPVCSDLVTDLRYIAEQAKLLLPMYDPSPQVWDNIQGSLEREGLVRPARARGRLLGSTGGSLRWIVMAAAVLLVVLAIARSRRNETGGAADTKQASLTPAQAGFSTQDDEQLLNAVAQQRPQLKATYESNLKQVNAYITDAQQGVQQNPNDEEARQHLRDAYDQKAMMYEMAARSLQ
jgi:hypothetical protein